LKIGIIDDARFELHEQEPGHPESPARVAAIRDALAGLRGQLTAIPARQAKRDELLMVHGAEYIGFVEETCLDREPAVLGPDVVVCRGSWMAALLAAGSAIEAVQWVLQGKGRRAFGNLRPPGHHASKDQAMGFCIFNNIALAAKWALIHGGLKRVAVIDWDVHHGNGTQDLFWDEPRVFYASMHQHPFYPGTGAARKKENLLSLPLAQGSGDEAYLRAFGETLVPALDAFKPELVLISCGFDAHQRDPLGGMALTERGYAEMTRMTVELAERHAEGRIVSLLEGGYDLRAIAESALAHVRAMGAG
jgi:acetoin utilization deacetylase AcuC-like enzyme